MKKLFSILIIVCCAGGVVGQEWFPHQIEWTDSTKIEVGGNGMFNYQSDKLTNDFMNVFYYGGTLDSTTRYDVSENLDEINFAGLEWSAGIQAKVFSDTLFGQTRWGWLAGLSQYNQINLRFHRDAYDLVFLGNKKFENDTAKATSSQFKQLSFNKASFGIFDKKTGSNIAISLIGGRNYTDITINNLELFTDTLGQELDMAMDTEINRTDTSFSPYFKMNGWGVGIDLNYYLTVEIDSNYSSLFLISVQNLGFINWSSQSLHFEKDTSINYEGFEANDIFDTDFSLFGEGESLNDSLGWGYTKRSIITPLPASISITKVPNIHSDRRLQSLFGIRMLLASNYRPFAFMGAYYRIHETVALSLTGGFGGYGGYRFGLRGDVRTSKNGFLSFGISNLSSFLRVNNNGMGAHVSYRVSF